MKKRFMSLCVCIMLAAALFTGCGNQKDGQPKKDGQTADSDKSGGALKVWILKTWSDTANQQLKERMAAYGEENNIKVEPEIINSSDISQKFNAAIESGQMPDVTFCMPFYLKTLESKGLLLDLTDTVKEIQETNGNLYENNVDFGVMDQKNVAVPLYNEPRVLFYRKDLLEEAGYKEPPKTFEELRTVAKDITDLGKGVYGFGDAFSLCDDCENNSRTYLWSWGGTEFSEDTLSVTVNSSQTKEMVQFFVDMYREDKSIPESVLSWDDSGNNQSYISGQAAMVINTPTILSALQEEGLEDILENTAIAPLPTGPAGDYNYGNGVFYVAHSKTKYPEEAKGLIKYIMDKEWYSSWIEAVAPVQVPTYEAMAEDSFWKEYPQEVCMEVIPGGRYLGYPGSLETANCDAYTARYLGTMWQDILVNNMSVDEAVEKWETSLQSVLK